MTRRSGRAEVQRRFWASVARLATVLAYGLGFGLAAAFVYNLPMNLAFVIAVLGSRAGETVAATAFPKEPSP